MIQPLAINQATPPGRMELANKVNELVAAHNKAHPDAAPAPAPAPTPAPVLTPSGPITLGPGNTTIANKHIAGPFGIVGNNGVQVGVLTVTNCVLDVVTGIYCSPCAELRISDTIINAKGLPDPYSVRGTYGKVISVGNKYHAEKAWRIYGPTSGSSKFDTFTGDRVMLGGGSVSEWNAPLNFDNFTFSDGRFAVNSVEIYSQSNNITFRDCDFTGTDHISIQNGATGIRFVNCRSSGSVISASYIGAQNFIRLHNGAASPTFA